MNTAAQKDIKSIVAQIIFEAKMGEDSWAHMFQYAINGLRELNQFKLSTRRAVKATVDTTINSVEIPSDCLKVLGVAIPYNGQIWMLTRNDDLVPTTTTVNGQETLDSTYHEGQSPSENIIYGYGNSGGRNDAYYVVDEENGRILLRGQAVASAFLFYVSSGVSVDTTTYVPMKAYSALRAYCNWKWHESDWEAANKIAYWQEQYEIELNKLEQFELPTLREVYDAFLKTMSPVIKR